jgi:hypothetical protein
LRRGAVSDANDCLLDENEAARELPVPGKGPVQNVLACSF